LSVYRRTESCDLLAVLDQLNTNTLSDSRVGLLGLNTDLLEDDALGVGRTTKGRGLEGGTEGAALPVKIRPLLVLSVRSQLSGGVKTAGLASRHDCYSRSETRIFLDDGRCDRLQLLLCWASRGYVLTG
jgi:hypothetical protein